MNIETELTRRVEHFITEHHLVDPSDTLLVGVSGGADSVCLLHILINLRNSLGIDLHIVHLNHQLRGAESDADANYMKDMAKKLGINCTVEACDVKSYQSEHGCSLEEAAREARYSFFTEVAERIGASAVAVGHTANDQAETIIMHMIRGTGLSGLQGMRPLFQWGLPESRTFTVIRPLLEVTRDETYLYCDTMNLEPRFDSSNLSLEYLRNRIRAEVMPKLVEYNPNVVEGFSRMARLIAEDVTYLDGEVKRVFGSVVENAPGGIALDNQAFAELPLPLGRNLLRTVLSELIGSLRDIEMVHIESIMEVMARPAGKELSLPYGFTLYGDYEKTFITSGENPLSLLPEIQGEWQVQIPGETTVPGWKITSDVLIGPPEKIDEGDFIAFFDIDLTGGNLTVRTRKDGDRFQPLGMDDSKKLQDFMVDAKIPRVWRDSVPLVCSGDRILWVVGWRIDHRTRVNNYTQRTLRVEFEME